jgi:ribonuclease-3
MALKASPIALVEEAQAVGEEEIVYRVIKETGPDHDKEFVIEVLCGRRVIGRGKGKSKKEAEQRAAKEALGNIRG